jgi:uroporphyrinogen decarboxylase
MSDSLRNDLLLRALLRQPTERTPVWLMRQAGRYLPEYRATREKAGSFMGLCTNPELACEVTLQPLERYPLDAAILFSDILTVPDAMGLGLTFETGEGPRFAYPVRTSTDIARLGVPDPEDDLGYVMEAVRVIRRALDGRVPLIGFAGSPWTLATYSVEGAGSADFRLAKSLMLSDPAAMDRLVGLLAEAVGAYLSAQIAAGAQAVMIFDTWGGVLTPAAYRRFSLEPMQRIVECLPRESRGRRVPCILYTKGGGGWLEAMAETGCDALGLDWTVSLGDARARVGQRVALQGNLDPCSLYAPPAVIEQEVAQVLASYGHGTGHVFNLGHGLHPGMDPAHVGACIEAVHALSPAYHSGPGAPGA